MIGESNLLQPLTILVLLFSAKMPVVEVKSGHRFATIPCVPILNCKFCFTCPSTFYFQPDHQIKVYETKRGAVAVGSEY